MHTLTLSTEALEAMRRAIAVEHRRTMRELASAFNNEDEGQIEFATSQYLAAATAVCELKNH